MCFFFVNLQDIMNSEKSYDSLPNFTAADCEFLPLQFLSLPEVVCNPTPASSLPLIYTCHKNVCFSMPVFAMGLQSDSAVANTHTLHARARPSFV